MRTSKWWLTVAWVSVFFAAIAGYSVRLLQDLMHPKQHIYIDESWVAASRNCWNGLSALHDTTISEDLADPVKFRAAFPGYGRMRDDQILKLAQSSQVSAPIPDQGLFLGWTPVRVPVKPQTTDYDALAKRFGGSVVTNHATPPSDMLCNVNDGLPAGFSSN
jgi:hypothetical protein